MKTHINLYHLIGLTFLLLISLGGLYAQPVFITLTTVPPTSFCAGDDVEFALDVSGPTSQFIQDVFLDGGSLWWKITNSSGSVLYHNGGQSTANLIFNFASGGDYTITATLYEGSDPTTEISRYPSPLFITINDSWASSDFNIEGINCLDLSVTVDPNISFNSTVAQWSFSPAVNVSTTGSATGLVTHTFPAPGTYDITLTIWTTACTSGGAPFTTTKQVTVNNCPGGNVQFDCTSESLFCPNIPPFTAEANFEWILPGGNQIYIGAGNQPCITPDECGSYTLIVHDNNSTQTYVYEVEKVPYDPGEIVASGPAEPGEALTLSLDDYSPDVAYIQWEFQVNDCCGLAPMWVPMTAGAQPIANYEDYLLNSSLTASIFTKCTMTSDFMFCFRAKVYCQNPASYPDCGYALVEKCIPICIGEPDSGGGVGPGGDPNPNRVQTPGNAQMPLHIYPNPTTNEVIVETQLNKAEQSVNVSVADTHGKLWKEIRIVSDTNGKIRHKLSLDGLPAGLYLIRLRDGEQSLSRLVVKQ